MTEVETLKQHAKRLDELQALPTAHSNQYELWVRLDVVVPLVQALEELTTNKKEEKKYVCPARDICPYYYAACTDPKQFCRIIEDTPEHYAKTREQL